MVAGAAGLCAGERAAQAELRARIEELRVRAPGSLDTRPSSAAGSSATSTTAPSSGSSRCRCSCAWPRASCEGDPDVAERLLDARSRSCGRALAELRELARGIHPAVLTDRGLGRALQALAERAPLPVELVRHAAGAAAAAVEAAAYFVVAEALTNVAKYAHAPARRRRDRAATTATLSSRSATTASAAPTRAAAPACAGWPTASPRSTAASRSTARRASGTSSGPRMPCA